MTAADELYSAARCALFEALTAPPKFRQVIIDLSARLEAEALLRGAKPARAALYRIAVV